MMTKSDTISEIMRINPTVNSAFLAGFSADQLNEYLERLNDLSALKPSCGASDLSRSGTRRPVIATAGAA